MRYFLVCLLCSSLAQAATYKLDTAHSQVGFTVKHLMVSNVKGQFKTFDGKFDFDPTKKDLKNIEITIDTSSIDTNNGKRDEHLKSDDFFNSSKFAKITFKADKGEFSPDGKTAKVMGQLTIRETTKPVTLDVIYNGEADMMGKKVAGFSASAKIKRSDFGMKWNKALEAGGVVVGDEVTINIDGEANPAEAAKAAKK